MPWCRVNFSFDKQVNYVIRSCFSHLRSIIQNAAAQLIGTIAAGSPEKLLEFKRLLYVFKSIHGLAPTHTTDLIKPHIALRSLKWNPQLLSDISKVSTKTEG